MRRGLAEENHNGGGGNHHNLDNDVHLEFYGRNFCDTGNDSLGFGQSGCAGYGSVGEGEVRSILDGLHSAIFRKNILEDSEKHDDDEGTEEHEDGILGALRDFLVESGGRTSIDVFALSWVLDSLLELRIFIEIESAMKGSHQSAKTSGDADHEHLRDADVETIGIRDGDEGHYCGSNR